MMDRPRIVLVDPLGPSRQELQRQLSRTVEVDLVETVADYQQALYRMEGLSADLVLVVAGDDPESALEMVRAAAAGFPRTAVLMAGTDHGVSLILRAVRAGAREFLPLPATGTDLLESIGRLCPRVGASAGMPRSPQVIAVTGAAGGVGCTSIAVNLAATLCKTMRRDTVIADFDLLLGSLEEGLGVIPDNSLEVLVRNLGELDPGLLKRWLPRHSSGLYVLPHPVSMDESARIEHESLRQVLLLLKETFDSIVIDTSKGLQATDFLAFDQADVVLVVLQLNLDCTRNTVRLLQYLNMFEGYAEKVRLVVNRVNSPLSEISVKKAEELLKTPVRWMVPNATRLFRPGRTRGVPIDEVEGGAGSKAHAALLGMARELSPLAQEAARPRRRLFGAFR